MLKYNLQFDLTQPVIILVDLPQNEADAQGQRPQ
jgi:hypothetical protein